MDGIVFRRDVGDWRDSIKRSNVMWIGRTRDVFCSEAINVYGYGENSVLIQTIWTHPPDGILAESMVMTQVPTMLKRILFDRFSRSRDVAVKFV